MLVGYLLDEYHISSKAAAKDFIEKYDAYNGPFPEYEYEEFTLHNGVLKPITGFDDREDFDG